MSAASPAPQSGGVVPQPLPGGLGGILGSLMTARDNEGEAEEVTIERGDELCEGSLIMLSDSRQQRRRLSPKHPGIPVHIPQMHGALGAFHVQPSSVAHPFGSN